VKITLHLISLRSTLHETILGSEWLKSVNHQKIIGFTAAFLNTTCLYLTLPTVSEAPLILQVELMRDWFTFVQHMKSTHSNGHANPRFKNLLIMLFYSSGANDAWWKHLSHWCNFSSEKERFANKRCRRKNSVRSAGHHWLTCNRCFLIGFCFEANEFLATFLPNWRTCTCTQNKFEKCSVMKSVIQNQNS